MAQTIQILRTNTNVAPTTLLPGALSAELGPQTKLWIGSGSGNRLLLSSDPADAAAAGGAYLKLAGGTLTGALTLAADPSVALGAATKQYTDAKDALRLLLAGGTLTGPLTLAADPAAALQPATKQYVDAADTTIRSTYLPIGGGTLTGALTLAADPAAALQPATKQYVDAKPSGAMILATPPASPVQGQLWWDSVGGQLYVYYNDGTSTQWVPASSVPGLTVPVAIAQGGTGAVTAPAALTALGAQPKAGTTTNDNAAAGQIGEYLIADIPKASSVGLTNNTTANIAQLPLTAGDWDVWINGTVTGQSATAFGNINLYLSTTAGAASSNNNGFVSRWACSPTQTPFINGDTTLNIGPVRISSATAVTMWFLAFCGFSGGAMNVYGCIQARRVR